MSSLVSNINVLPVVAAIAALACVIHDALSGGVSRSRRGWHLMTAGLALLALAVSVEGALFALSEAAAHYPLRAAAYCAATAAIALGILRWSSAAAADGPGRRELVQSESAEAAAGVWEKKYRALFEDSRDAVFIVSPEGRFTDVNPAGAELFGYGKHCGDELRKVNFRDELCAPGPEACHRLFEELAKTGAVRDNEITIKRKDGELLACRITATRVADTTGGPDVYRCILSDVTETRRLTEQLLQAQKMEAVGQLTGGIAHDFNNMIMATMMYSDLVTRTLPEDSPIAENVEKIKSITKRAEGLTRRLLAFSRKQIVRPRVVDVNAVVESVEKLLERVIGEDVAFSTEKSRESLKVMGDGGQIEQVITNLVTNARDAMPDGGNITIKTSTAIIDDAFIKGHGYGVEGRYSLITVRDTGTGMDENTARSVFEPFFTTKSADKGTGLGLSVAYGIVKQHSGFIEVESSPGAGTVFSIYLPLINKACDADEETEPRLTVARGVGTVLLAEDDPEVREVAKKVLEDGGYKVIEAVDGEDAVAKFADHSGRVELVILDVVMPRMNGKEARDRMAEISPGVKTLYMSGYTDDIISSKGVSDGDEVNFISKPVTPAELLTNVRNALDRKAA